MRRSHGHIGHALPVQYREAKWIGTTGMAAFKVAFTPKGDTPGFVWRFKFPNNSIGSTTNWYLIGVYASSGYTNWRIYKRLNDGAANSDHAMYVYANSNNGSSYIDFNYGYSEGWEQVTVKNDVITRCDGTTESILGHRQRYDKAGYIGIGCGWDGGTSSFMTQNSGFEFRFYYLALYKASALQYEFVPCVRKSDNKAGMYDLVNSVFHPSETGTDFTVGF